MEQESAEPEGADGATVSGQGAAVGGDDADERLLNLFWNRAELKKSFSDLREDRRQLSDRLAEESNATRRVEQRLERLEQLLANPDTGYTAIVYYQFRALWKGSTAQLEKFSEELKKQQQERERRKQIMEFNLARQKRLDRVSEAIKSIKQQSDQLKAAVLAREAELDALRGFWNYFKRRTAQEQVDLARLEHTEVRERIEQLFDKRIKIESEPWPEYPGLGVEGKRTINLAILALAQHLYLHFDANKLSQRAREAQVTALHETSYGSRADCEYLMEKIGAAVSAMETTRGHAEALKSRANFLRSAAQYKTPADTIPTLDSVGVIPVTVGGDDPERTIATIPIEVNILRDNYWSVHTVLRR